MAKFIQLWIWGVDAEGSLGSGAETGNDTNSRRRGVILFTWDKQHGPDTLIHKDIHRCRTVGDWHFGSRGAEFLRLPQPRVWGKVMRAFCEQSRSWLSGRGTLSHQTTKMHSFQRVSFFLQLFCLAEYNLYFKANKMVVTYGSPYSLTRALWKRKVIALPHQKRWWFG